MTHARLGTVLFAGIMWSGLAGAQTITEADCTSAKLGDSIPVATIGEPVLGLTLSAPKWNPAGRNPSSWCSVNGVMAPVDHAANAKPINFQVAFPVTWNGRAVQLGGGGMNGTIPMLAGAPLNQGYVTYGSDSGHQISFGRGGPGRGEANSDDWALNEEAIRNLGYMQMKKTHDAAMVLIERLYGKKPEYNYYVGSSQGGREALTVAERYPNDYNGIAANVPIVGFSSLMLGPALIRIHEKPQANWVTAAKINAIRGEFMRQCDKLDGLVDGVINNYMACRETFDVKQGKPNRHPWAARRCPNNVDPNPADTSADACLTDGQISTLEFAYSRYPFSQPLANGVTTFGMWLPNTDPSGSGLIANTRFRGQEGAAENAGSYNWIGVAGVTGFLMQDLQGNALDYVEGGKYNARRQALSAILDASNPDFSAFVRRGGKMIVAIGTNDTLASPGTQLDFYQSVLDKMGRPKVDGFARFYVLPQTGHGLTGTNYTTDGDGKKLDAKPIPNTFDRLAMLTEWVEKGVAPGKSIKVTAGERSMPMCSYPEYPKYVKGPAEAADSWQCSAR
ncbi:MAG TPA: tannase/feruloyl esterase family alpha/beta hydrolase [Bryobacteraceae bacterium]|nr:tannase/feruloyl esterase family alpha/beta hydrolase [Bryobacteraceae bacterium]